MNVKNVKKKYVGTSFNNNNKQKLIYLSKKKKKKICSILIYNLTWRKQTITSYPSHPNLSNGLQKLLKKKKNLNKIF